jgi:serine protein kinase
LVELRERLARFRDEEQRLAWEGTFLEYFDLVKAHPAIADLAHARVHNMIMSAGVEGEHSEKQFTFFANDIFGLEKPLEQLVDYFNSAAKRLEVRKRILLLMGPVGGGKSTIVALMKRGLEKHSRTDEGAIYAIKGCPMHEEPLHLIPPDLREDIYREYGIYIEGDLCPACRQMLQDKHGGKVEDVIVQRIALSEKNRTGIGTFTPSDPKSQDISELTGSVDLSTIGQYGSESDPRAYRFDGELNVANRGLMEFIEMLNSN